MNTKIIFGLLVIFILGAGVYFYYQKENTPLADEYAIRLGNQQAGASFTTVEYVKLAQPGFVHILVPDTFETNYFMAESGLLDAGEHYTLHIPNRYPDSDIYLVDERVTARLYIDNGSEDGVYDLDDELVLNLDGEPLTDSSVVK